MSKNPRSSARDNMNGQCGGVAGLSIQDGHRAHTSEDGRRSHPLAPKHQAISVQPPFQEPFPPWKSFFLGPPAGVRAPRGMACDISTQHNAVHGRLEEAFYWAKSEYQGGLLWRCLNPAPVMKLSPHFLVWLPASHWGRGGSWLFPGPCRLRVMSSLKHPYEHGRQYMEQ